MSVLLNHSEIDITAVRAQGPGGQNVNKVSNAVHLRFDIRSSSLPLFVQERLAALRDHHISQDAIVVIKSQKFRSLDKNRSEAIRRLQTLVDKAATPLKIRQATRPTRSSIQKRLVNKAKRADVKSSRQRTGYD